MIEEGKAKILTLKEIEYKGPGKRSIGFYNPVWKLDRDIEVLFCKYIYEKGARRFLDGFASTGIRGIRIKKEINDIEMDINDLNKASYKLITKNVELNGIKANVFNEDICNILSRKKYDYINIDPYGSPVRYVPCIFKGIRKKAYVSISATDIATLCGIFKKTCIRRYHAIPLKMQGMKEIGLRILIGYIARIASSYDYSFLPIISYSHVHYFRIYGIVEKGVKKAENAIEKIGWIYWENGWNKRNFDNPPKNFGGPLWIGKLFNEKILKELLIKSKDAKIKKLFQTFIEENFSISYYETKKIAKEMKKKQPPIERLIRKLTANGWRAARSHFAGDAIKTTASYDEIKRLF